MRIADPPRPGSGEDEAILSSSESSRHMRYLMLVLALGALVLWLLPLRSSFWLDETVTAWVVQGSLGSAIHRALEFQPMFPTYYVVAWAARAIGGGQEWVLRLPSLLAMGGATFFVARIARRLFDPETGIIAAIVFATSVQGAYAATDARPYALGILALVIATFLLIRWLDTGDVRLALGMIVAAAAVLYVHYLFGFALIAHLFYALRRRKDVGSPKLVGALLAFVLLLVPLAPWFLQTFDRRSVLSIGVGGATELAAALVPASMAAGLLLGVLLAGPALRRGRPILAASTQDLHFLAIWAIAPPVCLLVVSHAAGVGIFEPRYFSSALPATSMLAAAGIRMLDPMKARRTIIVVLVFVSIFVARPLAHTDDSGFLQNWRGALEAVAATTRSQPVPVVLQSGLIEARDVTLMRDPRWVPYLTTPAQVYETGGTLVPAPYSLTPTEQNFIDRTIVPRLITSDRFVLITAGSDGSLEFWLQGRLSGMGYSWEQLGHFGIVRVLVFSRPDEPN